MTTEPRASLVEDLLPCPFCGGEAKLVSGTSSTVQCQNDQCIIGDPAPFNDFSHRADAIAAWNTRLEALRTQGDAEAKWHIAVWNACRDRGMSQDAALGLIAKAASDPTMPPASPTQASSREEG